MEDLDVGSLRFEAVVDLDARIACDELDELQTNQAFSQVSRNNA
jgi:hypothetical protein